MLEITWNKSPPRSVSSLGKLPKEQGRKSDKKTTTSSSLQEGHIGFVSSEREMV